MARKILCAIDGTKAAKAAATCAIGLAKVTGSKLTFLHVDVVPKAPKRTDFWDARLAPAAEPQSNKYLSAAAKMATTADLDGAMCVLVSGRNVAKAIVGYATKHKYEHIVVGTEVTNELQRILLGSVASWVIGHAPCPVTVCR